MIPEHGPCHDGQACVLGVKARRVRKTGPGYPLTVVSCKTHGDCFTLYPPGHVPYGREPLVLLTPEGHSVTRDRAPPYQDTYFQAALDAVGRPLWPEEGTEGSDQPRYATQARRVHRCSQLLGLLASAWDKVVDSLWSTLGIPAGTWQQARKWVVNLKGIRGKSKAIVQLLALLPETNHSFFGLATLGHDAGFWPRPQAETPHLSSTPALFRC